MLCMPARNQDTWSFHSIFSAGSSSKGCAGKHERSRVWVRQGTLHGLVLKLKALCYTHIKVDARPYGTYMKVSARGYNSPFKVNSCQESLQAKIFELRVKTFFFHEEYNVFNEYSL